MKRRRPTADELKTARLIAGLSIVQTAQLVGVTVRTIRNWERGRHRAPAGRARAHPLCQRLRHP
ncbi:MAG: helix-turn-helix transcriptional regulator [Burkholderiales bacterium]|nr:helix-turn-helix transcriptional regulator [Burkholderiales bacterium]